MNAEKVIALSKDKELQQYIQRECVRHSKREELQEEFFSAAWEYIGTAAPEACDSTTLRRLTYNAITRAYRKELARRKFVAELAESYELEQADPQSSIPACRGNEKGIVFQPHELIQEIEPGLFVPLFQGARTAENDVDEDW